MRKMLLLSLLTAPAHACCGAGGLIILLMYPLLGALLCLVWWWSTFTARHLTPSCPRFLGGVTGVVGYIYVLLSGVLVVCVRTVPWLPELLSFFIFSLVSTSFFAMLPGLVLAAFRRRL